MSWLWISPHLDDVVLSCAGSLGRTRAAGNDVTVATVFSSGDAGYDCRRREDKAALAHLGARAIHLGFPDAPFRAGLRRSYASLVLESDVDAALLAEVGDAIAQLACDHDADRLFLPLGVGRHIDHRTVFATHALLANPSRTLAFYEDRPYAFARIFVDLRMTEIGAVTAAFDERATRVALGTAFHDQAFLRAYVPPAERATAIAAHLKLASAPLARPLFDLYDATALFTDDELARAARAVAHYETQAADLFGSTDPDVIAAAYAAASQLIGDARFAERTYRYSSRFFQSVRPNPAMPDPVG